MALVIGTGDFQGLEINLVRPGSRARFLQQLLVCAQDQAELWERLTNLAVMPGGVIAATPHNHDGDNSAVIPIPAANNYLAATLPAARTGTTSGEWAPVELQVLKTPPGVSHYFVSLWGSQGQPQLTDSARVKTLDSSMAIVEQNAQFLELPAIATGLTEYRARISVADDDVNTFVIECWDSEFRNGSSTVPQEERTIRSVSIRPALADSVPVQSYTPPAVPIGDVVVPDATYNWIAGGPSAFAAFDSQMFDDGEALSSFLTQKLNANQALIWELLTGTPAGNNPAGHANRESYLGHNHMDAGSANLEDSGVDIDHLLGAWAYGVAREPPLAPDGRPSFDDPGNSWTGRLHGPALTVGGNVWRELARHKFRIPLALADNLEDSVGGATTKLKAAALVYHDSAKSGGMDLEFQLMSALEGLSGSAVVVAAPVGPPGLKLVLANDLDKAAVVHVGGVLNHTLKIRARSVNTDATANLIYSSCIWYEG